MKGRILVSILVCSALGASALPGASDADFLFANRGPGSPPEVLWISAAALEAFEKEGPNARAIGPLSAKSLSQKIRSAKAVRASEGCTGVPMGDVIGGAPEKPVSLDVTLSRVPISFVARVESRDAGWEPIPEYGEFGLVATRLMVRVVEVLRDESGTLHDGATFTMLQEGGSFVLDAVRFCTRDPDAQPVSVGDTLFVPAQVSDLDSPYLPSPPEFLLKDGLLVPVGGRGYRPPSLPLAKVRAVISDGPKR